MTSERTSVSWNRSIFLVLNLAVCSAVTSACVMETTNESETESDEQREEGSATPPSIQHDSRVITFDHRSHGPYDQQSAWQDFGNVYGSYSWFVGNRARIFGYGVGYSPGLSVLLSPSRPREQSYTAWLTTVPSATRRFLQFDLKLEDDFDLGDGGYHETKLGGLSGGNHCHSCQNDGTTCNDGTGGFSARFILASSDRYAFIRPYVYGVFNGGVGICGNEDGGRFPVAAGAWYTLRVEVRLGDTTKWPRDHLRMMVKRTGSRDWTSLYDGRRSLRGSYGWGVTRVAIELARGGAGGLYVRHDSHVVYDNIQWGVLGVSSSGGAG